MIYVTLSKNYKLKFGHDLGEVSVDLNNSDLKQRDLELTGSLNIILMTYLQEILEK